MSVRACLIVPVYNHGDQLATMVERVTAYPLPCVLINDGSNATTVAQLEAIRAQHPDVAILHHARNMGKGAACMTGLRHAWTHGFTHAVQIDADGQHDLDDLPTFLAAATAEPQALIMGTPRFDASVPAIRYYGRYVTHALVWLECLSTALRDTLCGYRVYPLEATIALLDRTSPGRRMDFDPEIAVRLYWAGVRPVYNPASPSHFRMVRDNLRLSWMHTRLLCGMLGRLPRRLSMP